MRASDKVDQIALALNRAQAIMEGATKGSINPFFHSRYADLAEVWDTCRKPLADNGLSLVQSIDAERASLFLGKVPLRNKEGHVTGEREAQYIWLSVTSRLLHMSEQWFESVIEMPVEADPQSIGKVVTYLRRYTMMALIGIAPEDDDGEAALGRGASAPVTERKPAATSQQSAAPPLCGIHKSPMRQAQTGHWYCPMKDEGRSCKYQVPKPTASPSPNGDVSPPPPSDTQAATPAARPAPDGGQPGETRVQGHQQPQQAASAVQGRGRPDLTAVASVGASYAQPPVEESPTETVGFQNWGDVAGACKNLGVTANQVFALASEKSGKRFTSWIAMGEAGWTFEKAWALAQEIKATL